MHAMITWYFNLCIRTIVGLHSRGCFYAYTDQAGIAYLAPIVGWHPFGILPVILFVSAWKRKSHRLLKTFLLVEGTFVPWTVAVLPGLFETGRAHLSSYFLIFCKSIALAGLKQLILGHRLTGAVTASLWLLRTRNLPRCMRESPTW